MKNFNEFIEETFVYGGGSYNPIFGSSPKNGFMASIKGTEIQTSTNKRYLNRILSSFLANNIDLLEHNENYFIGTWICNEVIYIDISVNFKHKRDALKFGLYNDQKAIFDIDSNECIYLPSRQKAGTMTQQKTYNDLLIDKLLNS